MNLKDVKNFIQGNLLSYADDVGIGVPHIREQANMRANKCPECVQAGKCVECGCKTPNMFFSPQKECSKKRWGKMLSKDDWEKMKELFRNNEIPE